MKTLEEMVAVLDQTGFPIANVVFPKDEPHDPPYLIWLTTGSTDLYADGTNYLEVPDVQVELYTLRKDPASEKKVQSALSDSGFTYSKDEGWLDDEQMYMVIYNFALC